MKKVFKFILKLIEIFIILYVIFMSTCLLCRNKFGYTQFGEKTLVSIKNKDTKYLTEFNKNSLVIFEEVDMDDVEVGDELYYYGVKNEKYVIYKGKVTDKKGEASDTLYEFDNDSKLTVSSNKVLGEFDEEYNDLGGVLLFLESRVGFLIFVILPILLLFIYEIYDLIITVKYDDDGIKEEKKSKKKEEIETL